MAYTSLTFQTIVVLSMGIAPIFVFLHPGKEKNRQDERKILIRISQTKPVTSCACPDDMKLSKDWRTCISKTPTPKKTSTSSPAKRKPKDNQFETTKATVLHGEAAVMPVAQEDARWLCCKVLLNIDCQLAGGRSDNQCNLRSCHLCHPCRSLCRPQVHDKLAYYNNLLAPSGGLVFILVYYISEHPLFQIFQILKCLKDPTCAILFKSMGFKDIKYDFPVYQMEIHKYTNTQVRKYTKTKCLKYPTCAIFLKSMGFKDIKYIINTLFQI